jgi:excisionase family DNA binding protein
MHSEAAAIIAFAGQPGERYTLQDAAEALLVHEETVRRWIVRGYLRAACDHRGVYRIRRRALRRALMDYPTVANDIAKAQVKRMKAARRAGNGAAVQRRRL